MLVLLSMGMTWIAGVLALYGLLGGKKLLPSPYHVRVVATLWPFVIVFGIGYGVWKLFMLIPRETQKTAVAMKAVIDWRYHDGKLLMAPKPSYTEEDMEEVNRLLEKEL